MKKTKFINNNLKILTKRVKGLVKLITIKQVTQQRIKTKFLEGKNLNV